MARKKNSETTTAAEIKAEKSIKEDTKKSSSAKKAKTDSAVKEADKAKEAAAAKQSVSEDNAKNPGAAKKAKTAQEDLIKVQLGSSEFDITNIKKAVEEDFRNKHKGSRFKNVEIYVKPEDGMAYYVVNSKYSDKIAL